MNQVINPAPSTTAVPFMPTYPTYPTYPLNPAPQDYGNGSASTNYIQYAGRPVIKALNNVVLCEPFKTNAVKKKERSGFATIDQKVTLAGLMVLVGNAEIPTGSTVYVRAEACQAGWGKEVFESNTVAQFIRVPIAEIVFMNGYDTAPWSYPWTITAVNNNGNGVLDCNGATTWSAT